MNLVIDIGNTATKIAIFDKETLLEVKTEQGKSLSALTYFKVKYEITRGIVSSVSTHTPEIEKILSEQPFPIIALSHTTPVPIINKYRTPHTLGMDRLAAVVGATSIHPNTPLLVIDSGTAITFDYVDEFGQYWGGNISPGIETRLKALHTFCSKLPAVSSEGDTPEYGYSTETAIRSGVIRGIRFEIEGYIAEMKRKKPALLTFLTGGGTFSFDANAKNSIFADVFLVLKGLNSILNYNDVTT